MGADVSKPRKRGKRPAKKERKPVPSRTEPATLDSLLDSITRKVERRVQAQLSRMVMPEVSQGHEALDGLLSGLAKIDAALGPDDIDHSEEEE